MQILDFFTKAVWRPIESTDTFVTWFNKTLGIKTPDQLIKEYKGIVYACVTAICEDVAKYEPYFFKYDKNGNESIVLNHPFFQLLHKPSPNLTQYNLFEATQSYLELTGEAFWYLSLGERTRKPYEIDYMNPAKVKIATGDNGEVIGYTFRKSDGTEIPLDVDEVIHFKTFNPDNPYRGLGTVQAGLLQIRTENAASEFQYNFLENQASPSGVIQVTGKISKEAFAKLKRKWKEGHQGISNAGKTLFIRNGEVKFEKIGLSLSELDMSTLKSMTEEDVLKIFKVPKVILGESDTSGLGRATIEGAEYIFAKRTIDPRLTRIDDTLKLYVKKAYGDDTIEIGHESQVPEDMAAELEEDEAGVDKWLTRNEIRKKRGLEPLDGGDTLYSTFQQIPIEVPNPQAVPVESEKDLGTVIITKSHMKDCSCRACKKKV